MDWKSDLIPLLAPRSIAIVGASSSSKSFVGPMYKNLIQHGYAGEIYPVNPRYEEIWGQKCYPNLLAIPGEIDCALIGVARDYVLESLKNCAEKKVKSAIVVAAGFGESAEAAGPSLQEELIRVAEGAQIRLVGPNCMGLMSFHDRYFPYFGTLPEPMLSGNVSLLSQSGSMQRKILYACQGRGIGINYFFGMGNSAVLDPADVFWFMVNDSRTKVMAGFIEGFRNVEKLKKVIDRAHERSVPIVLLKVGSSEKGQRAALTHTGSLAGSAESYRAFFKQSGVIFVNDLEELVESIELLVHPQIPRGNGLGVMTLSGGACSLIADACEDFGIELPEFEPRTVEGLSSGLISSYFPVQNPCDITGPAFGSVEEFSKVTELFLNDENFDMCLFEAFEPTLLSGAERAVLEDKISKFAEMGKGSNKLPILLSTVSTNLSPHGLEMRKKWDIPFVQGTRRTIKVLRSVMDYFTFLRERETKSMGISEEGPPVSRSIVEKSIPAISGPLSESQSKKILSHYGIPTTREEAVSSLQEALDAAKRIGYPVVLKVDSSAIVHKTEAGAVILNLTNAEDLKEGYQRILDNVRRYDPMAQIEGLLVQEMVSGGTEVLVGMQHDSQLGPVIIFALGGIFVEIFHDRSLRVAPLTRRDAERMVDEILGVALLKGARGRPKGDLHAVVDVLLKISRLSMDCRDRIASLDINPLFVFEEGKGVKMGDALLVFK
jgi:acyl-CoA synthetase (NDP forming)